MYAAESMFKAKKAATRDEAKTKIGSKSFKSTFDAANKALPALPAEEVTCGDEKLLWQYDQTTNILSFTHKNIWADCAAKITQSSFYGLNGQVYEIRETVTDGFADCMCFFDIRGEFAVVSSQNIILKIRNGNTLVWEGSLDLTMETGEELIKADVGYCN